jgi:hypothetical protein
MSMDANTITTIGVVLGAGIAVLFVFLILVYAGFRMGRIQSGRPVQPIIPRKDAPTPVEEDPYREPMYGKPSERIPTT